MNYEMTHGFNAYYDAGPLANSQGMIGTKHTRIQDRKLDYHFYAHFHPYVAELISRLIQQSVRGLQAADTEYARDSLGNPIRIGNTNQPKPKLYAELFEGYAPTELVHKPYPVKELDFTPEAAYGVYNWELFFHVPLLIAMHLSKNGRYEEAQGWFHYLFDPTDDSDGPTPERFWKVRPFQTTDVRRIEDILVNLSTGADLGLQRQTIHSIEKWKIAPFRPHVIARFRPTAYMFKTVMAYLDNLIAWGDSLFRQDTIEGINEATQIYILAANILGPRPQAVPAKGTLQARSYADLRLSLNAFGNALQQLESEIPFDLAPLPSDNTASSGLVSLRSIGQTLYFGVPRNDKLLGYWDSIANRLFKIHNSLNLQGVFRQLPLFDPPIDPALLARAAAAGLDVAAVVAGINQPLPLVRFQVLVQKAAEICAEVKSLGANLLSAIEKEDNEALAVIRARHERSILQLAEVVKYGQWQEAIKAREGLEQSLANVVQRYVYYERQLGQKTGDILIPTLDVLDVGLLDKQKLKVEETEVVLRGIPVDIAQDIVGLAGGRIVSSYEQEELALQAVAEGLQLASGVLEAVAGVMAFIPEFQGRVTPWGLGAGLTYGGKALSTAMNFMASASRTASGVANYAAGRAAKIGSYARREQEWAYQSNLAAGEITQTFKQLRAAQIREAIAEREWHNHQQQIKNAQEIETFLTDEKTGKKTNQAFYAWMQREVKGLYAQVFQFAFDIAKKAERALQHELGDPGVTFLQYGYLAGREGLLAGEKLYLDIKRMEMGYHDLNQREYELTKHVSLLQVNPLALVELRTTGRCMVALPEVLFDMDGPGHYFRRIKSVAVSIPCVAGPYTGVNCRLTLLRSSIRKTSTLREGKYARVEDQDDERFDDYGGSLQSIVTSSGQNDSGLFETNLRDERYLPFEGAGVVGEWHLELPHPVHQFAYDTIADVVLHIRYTAREGGDLLRDVAMENLQDMIETGRVAGSMRLFSVRHEFPSAWAQFLEEGKGQPEGTYVPLTLALQAEHYPFWAAPEPSELVRASFYAQGLKDRVEVLDKVKADRTKHLDAQSFSLEPGLWKDSPKKPQPISKFTLYFETTSMSDLWLVVTWAKHSH